MNDYTNGRNNTPAPGADCSKSLLSLLQVESPLSFLIKLFLFCFFKSPQIIWHFLRILSDCNGQSWESHLHSLQLRLGTEPQLQPARTHIIPLQTHFKWHTHTQGKCFQQWGTLLCHFLEWLFLHKESFKRKKISYPVILPFLSWILIKFCLCNNLLM